MSGRMITTERIALIAYFRYQVLTDLRDNFICGIWRSIPRKRSEPDRCFCDCSVWNAPSGLFDKPDIAPHQSQRPREEALANNVGKYKQVASFPAESYHNLEICEAADSLIQTKRFPESTRGIELNSRRLEIKAQ